MRAVTTMTTTMTPGRCHRTVIVCFIWVRDETPDANQMFRLTTLVFISIKKCFYLFRFSLFFNQLRHFSSRRFLNVPPKYLIVLTFSDIPLTPFMRPPFHEESERCT